MSKSKMKDGIVERAASRLPIGLAAVFLACVCGCGDKQGVPETSYPESSTSPNALSLVERPVDLAWHFASSITDDPEDQAAYQAKVALFRFRRDGDVDDALKLGHAIYRWNRGLVLAEVAESLVRSGARERAATVIQAVEEIAEKGVDQGWERDRIRLALGNAKALLSPGGDDLLAKEAAAKNPAMAMQTLDKMWASAADVKGLLLFSTQMDVVDTALSCGQNEYARGKADAVAEAMRGVTAPAYMLLPVKTRLAKVLAKVGNKAMALEMAQSVVPEVGGVMNIEQPALLADAAAALHLADPDGETAAEKHFLEAIRLAGGLANRRPRCKALCDIALSLEECGMQSGTILSALESEARRLS